ncbi:MAG: GNAT family N-acetyltransferase [Actinobacteria bacterium]|nr:GNAT family N-acetyltransferase [Actinomycetota bacterium]
MPAEFLAGLDPAERAEAHRAHLRAPDPGTSRWVGELEGSVAGFSVIGPARPGFGEPGWGEVYAIYVDPDRQRLGIGRALLDHAVATLRARRRPGAVLWVLRDNAPARRFYEAMGWASDGARKGFEVPGTSGVEVAEVRYVLPFG